MTRRNTIITAFLLLVAVMSTLPCYAQGAPNGTRVALSDGPPPDFWTKLYFTVGTTYYTCLAPNVMSLYNLTVSSVSHASPALVTSSAHGFDSTQSPTVVISGGTGTWAAFNGTFVATYVDANTFSIPVDTTSFGPVTGTLVYKASAPRTNQPVWAVKKIAIDGSGNPRAEVWAIGGYSNLCAYLSQSYQ